MGVADAGLGDGRVFGVQLAADPAPRQALGDDSGSSGAHERVEHQVARSGSREDARFHQRFREGCEMRLAEGLSWDGPDAPLVSRIRSFQIRYCALASSFSVNATV